MIAEDTVEGIGKNMQGQAYEECNLKCRRYKRERSMPWFATLGGLTKGLQGKETAWNRESIAGRAST
jgi:hypothetical protein